MNEDLEINADELLKHVYEINIKKNMNSFPLLVRKREVKRFKTNYFAFWARLVNSSESIVFKTKILENIIKMLVSFSK